MGISLGGHGRARSKGRQDTIADRPGPPQIAGAFFFHSSRGTMLKSITESTMTASTNGSSPPRAQRMRVTFQGDRGAYAESAIAQIWRHRVEQIPVPTFTGALRSVDEGSADACVIPVENSIVGRVEAGWQALAAYPGMRVVGEAFVAVNHCLLAPKGATLQGLVAVSSHPVALAQCGRFFENHPWIKACK